MVRPGSGNLPKGLHKVASVNAAPVLVPITSPESCDFCREPAEFTITRANGPRAVCAHHGAELSRGIIAETIALHERQTTDHAYLKYMFAAYCETATWSRELEPDQITNAEADDMWNDCAVFFLHNRDILRGFLPWAADPGAAGHDFSLTRNGHGAGFWDRGAGKAGEILTAAAKLYGCDYLAAEFNECVVCGETFDYCQGHGEIGDPAGFAILQQHAAE